MKKYLLPILIVLTLAATLSINEHGETRGCEVVVIFHRWYIKEVYMGDTTVSKRCEVTRYVQACDGFVVDEWEDDTCNNPLGN